MRFEFVLLVGLCFFQLANHDTIRDIVSELTYYPSGQNYVWESESQECYFRAHNLYCPKNCIPTRFQVHKDCAYVAFPRYRFGVAATLTRMPLTGGPKCLNPMYAFPSWLVNYERNCDGIQSAVDLVMDCTGILWVLDVGITCSLTDTPVTKAPPRVFGICAHTAKVMHVFVLSSVVVPCSRLQFIQVERNCMTGVKVLYISDAGSRAIIYWNVAEGKGYRVQLPCLVTCGCKKLDVLYIFLLPDIVGVPTLYFSYLCAKNLYSIKTFLIHRGATRGAIVELGTKPGLLVFLGTDNTRFVFFRLRGQTDLYMWNVKRVFKTRNMLLVRRGDHCLFATHVAVGYKYIIYALESNFQDYIQCKLGCPGVSTRLSPLVKECCPCA